MLKWARADLKRRIGMDRGGRLPNRSRSPDFTALRYQRLGKEITTLIKAVTCCMFSVAGLVKMFSYSRNPALEIPYMRYPDQGGEVPVILINSFANAFGFLAIITIANCTLVLLYKAGHYRIVKAWLITGSALILLVTGYYFLGRLLFLFNAPTDHFSCALVTWNVGVGGIVALYFDAPCQLQQSYLVYASVLMAMVLEEAFPNWTSWIFLLLVSLWDVFAVLCFLGPLRVLHETAKKRNEPLFPALVFSTSSAWCYEIASAENVLERGLKLGLGDFIFYGMLLGKASRHGTMAALVACYVSVLVGVLLTVMLLFVFRKPLPALPFSVVLGLGSYFASAIFLDPFMEAVDFLAY
ncbi:hypothetical protein V5799_008306 [Amblyomma americanum]|uniref:Presenilin n=1 Tax=Amblyomma americanum TaxID=6943 RepID=A0AAQ4FF99_AMBAM